MGRKIKRAPKRRKYCLGVCLLEQVRWRSSDRKIYLEQEFRCKFFIKALMESNLRAN